MLEKIVLLLIKVLKQMHLIQDGQLLLLEKLYLEVDLLWKCWKIGLLLEGIGYGIGKGIIWIGMVRHLLDLIIINY
jgi:hypothetical protein